MYLDKCIDWLKTNFFFSFPTRRIFHFLCGAHVEGFFFRHSIECQVKRFMSKNLDIFRLRLDVVYRLYSAL